MRTAAQMVFSSYPLSTPSYKGRANHPALQIFTASLQSLAVLHAPLQLGSNVTAFSDTEEYSLRSIAILGCNIYSHITVAHVTLPKAVLSTVKIFAVWVA